MSCLETDYSLRDGFLIIVTPLVVSNGDNSEDCDIVVMKEYDNVHNRRLLKIGALGIGLMVHGLTNPLAAD